LRKLDWTSYKTILIAALIIRLIAAIFSQGYGMHDDHFLIVESSASWVDGYDYNDWLPWSKGNPGIPQGHSFTYVGINYFYFVTFKWIGISDPKILMLFNRLFHALFSMLVVYFGIKITEKLSPKESSKNNAVIVGWILALLWMLPFLSVRNLVEIVSIPLLMWGTWLMIKHDDDDSKSSIKYKVNFLYAGLLIGMAISFRYQIGVFAFGVAAVYFLQFKWTKFLLFAFGVVLIFCLTQGLVDYLIWGYPFAEFLGYFTYNVNEGTAYIPNNNYFMYVGVLIASCLFPLGLLLGIGFFASVKKYWVIFVPVLLFILFHSFYPSKQERFILPVLPLFIILGVIGYHLFFVKEIWKKIWRFSYRFFWILNIPLLLILSVAYSKKSRVEAMYYFYESKEIPEKVLFEGTGESSVSMAPKFYSGQWYFATLDRTDPNQLLTIFPGHNYDYILFYGEKDLQKRIDSYKVIYPKMELKKQCFPSAVDRFLRWLNPRNTNEYIEVWKTYEIPS